MLDAEASYWPGLILGTNLQLTQECINPHEHALALEKIMAAQALAEEISSKLAREVQAACDELNTEEHKGVSVCRGLCSKSLQEQRCEMCEMCKVFGICLTVFTDRQGHARKCKSWGDLPAQRWYVLVFWTTLDHLGWDFLRVSLFPEAFGSSLCAGHVEGLWVPLPGTDAVALTLSNTSSL